MLKTFLYRLYPKKSQEKEFLKWLKECRWLYNHFLEERKTIYEKTNQNLGYYQQNKEIPYLKDKCPSLKSVYSQILQDVAMRVDLAFKAFFKRIKSGETPGYPRFKGYGRYHSFTYPQAENCCWFFKDKIRFSKLGEIKAVMDRSIEGRMKTCTIKKSPTGKWYASFICETQRSKYLEYSPDKIGIDVGLNCFAALSSGSKIRNPRFFRAEEKALAKVQSKRDKSLKDSPERTRKNKAVTRIHERISFRRKNFAHQQSRKLVNRFGFIAVEDLEVNRMLQNRRLSKSISDAAWSMFFSFLLYKAANAGRIIVRVNPAYTTQTCSSCGERQKLNLSQRQYLCPHCKLNMDRDLNASLNILRLGLQSVGVESLEAPTLVGE